MCACSLHMDYTHILAHKPPPPPHTHTHCSLPAQPQRAVLRPGQRVQRLRAHDQDWLRGGGCCVWVCFVCIVHVHKCVCACARCTMIKIGYGSVGAVYGYVTMCPPPPPQHTHTHTYTHTRARAWGPHPRGHDHPLPTLTQYACLCPAACGQDDQRPDHSLQPGGWAGCVGVSVCWW